MNVKLKNKIIQKKNLKNVNIKDIKKKLRNILNYVLFIILNVYVVKIIF